MHGEDTCVIYTMQFMIVEVLLQIDKLADNQNQANQLQTRIISSLETIVMLQLKNITGKNQFISGSLLRTETENTRPPPEFISQTQFKNLLEIKEETAVQEGREEKIEKFKQGLGKNLYVTASKAYPGVHIRYYFQNELPSRTGIGIRFTEWNRHNYGTVDTVKNHLAVKI